MADKIWSVNPDAYIILEHFAPDTEEMELAAYGMMLWNNRNYDYSEAAMGYSSDLTYASYLGRGWIVPKSCEHTWKAMTRNGSCIKPSHGVIPRAVTIPRIKKLP